MKMYLRFIRVYFKVLSALSPAKAGKQAFYLFQKTRRLPFKPMEQEYYDQCKRFIVPYKFGDVHCFELGDPKGQLAILVHGWESNAGSLGGVAYVLAKQGKRVVSIDLPGHGHSSETHANLYKFKLALTALFKYLEPKEPITVIGHSMGSATCAFTLSELDYECGNLIFLTSPVEMRKVFVYYQDLLGLSDKSMEVLLKMAEDLLGEPIEEMTVTKKAAMVNYKELTIIHDKHDKVIPFQYSQEMNKELSNSSLIGLEHAGHYRMLWSKELLENVDKKTKGEGKRIAVLA